MSKILIKNGLVIDPAQNISQQLDVLVIDGKVAEMSNNCTQEADIVIDATDKWVTPGFIELHAHLREPGFEYKEDIRSGSEAALNGGYTTVCAMPNTSPVLDNGPLVSYVKQRGNDVNLIKVEVIGAVSKGLAGKELAEMGFMQKAGAIAFSDDGKPIMNAQLMRNALEYSKMFGKPVVAHEEDYNLSQPGMINEGLIATKLGLAGIPKAAEEVMTARDIILAELTGGHVHIAHVSSTLTVEMVRQAKAKGIKVTAEVTPHHLLLTDTLVDETGYDTNTKMNPPLRESAEQDALLAGLKDGTIDAIATDHAPHHFDDKDVEYNYAAMGISGLETAFAVLNTKLVKTGLLDKETLISKLTYEPATVFAFNRGSLRNGSDADITIIDPNAEWIVDAKKLATKGKNTPWLAAKLQGRVDTVLVDGAIKLHRGELYV